MAEQGNGRFEVLEGFEGLVDAREAQVGNLVEPLERVQDRQADLMRLDLRSAGGPDGLFDLLGEHGQVIFGDGTALAGLADTVDDLAAAERLADA